MDDSGDVDENNDFTSLGNSGRRFLCFATVIRRTWYSSPCDGPLNRGQRKEVSR